MSKMAKTLRKLGYSDFEDKEEGEFVVTKNIETATPVSTSDINNIVFPTSEINSIISPAADTNNSTATPTSAPSERLCPEEWRQIGEGCYQIVTEQ